MSYITFKNICKSYDNKTQVLKGIDLEVEEGGTSPTWMPASDILAWCSSSTACFPT